jgi:hypothetical protein
MKGFLLLVIGGLASYYAYSTWFAKPEPPPAPAAVARSPKVEPVDFAIKSRVRKLFEEWKRQQLSGQKGQHGAMANSPEEEGRQIKKLLFRNGRYSESALAEVVARSLRELGVAESEISAATSGVMSLQGN